MVVQWDVQVSHFGMLGLSERVEVPDDELQQCETNDDRQALIRESVQEAFCELLAFHWEKVQEGV